MRALLIVNDNATSTTPGVRSVLARALSTEIPLEVVNTTHRGHASELAADAVKQKMDVIIALGGDGTVHEIVNGLIGDTRPVADQLPALAVLPGGSANVFARALGMPRDPIEATATIIEGIHEKRHRAISLGRADERWFTFCTGFGLDANIIHKVEKSRKKGRVASPARYLAAGLAEITKESYKSRKKPAPLELHIPGQDPIEGFSTIIVQNTDPWTYVGKLPIHASKKASFDSNLDIFGIKHLGPTVVARAARQILLSKSGLKGKAICQFHDIKDFTIRSNEKIGIQIDGEYLGEHDTVHLTSVARAINVVV